MDATLFEVCLQLPGDARLVDAVSDVAATAARYAGCADVDAAAFATVVEGVMAQCLGGALMSVVVRRQHGPVEVLIECPKQFEPAPVQDQRISIGWATEGGRSMCRVSRSL